MDCRLRHHSSKIRTGVFLAAAFLVAQASGLALDAGYAASTQYDPAVVQALGGPGRPPTNDPAFTCKALGIALGGGDTAVVSPSSGGAYDAAREINYSETCWLPAGCIVSPKDSRQTARAISIIGQLQTKFAVRGGGHNDNPGFASVDGSGVLISLSNLTTMALASGGGSVTVGAGSRWDAVYTYLSAKGLVAVGGRVGMVGVGGFLLGGGVSYHTSQYGLGMDNVKSFEVVLSSGRIVTACASEYADLYKGLRGGAANFGIVTAFELYTYPSGPLNYEVRQYGFNQSRQALQALASYQLDGQKDPLSRVDLTISSTACTALLLYLKPVSHAPAFRAFGSIPSYKQLMPPTNGSLVGMLALGRLAFPQAHVRSYGETFSHKVDAAFAVEAHEIFRAETANLPPGAEATWVPIAVGATAAEMGRRNGGNLLGLSAVPQQWHEWYLQWEDAAHDDQLRALGAAITAKLTAAARARGVLLPYLFMNTASAEQQVLQSFGRGNVDHIKRVAAKYDPGQVFQKLQNKGFLIRDI
ncbi:hypothetical protein INS49_000082 [Diaporthe citri]|uniref:uncharacterized protein n=1 Tax=Diaporthe citri TaxID=83186 RepID=UPI001C816A56|nr:uncharacterized protein INS49_000082 [Diaporthe citri]KAG6365906.1 hypothetical protein INS49_000082 [Diaporthe citri]